ncbi:PucR family transcriptional regulator ligand-binding domain-containing protein [Metabacillus litoralis]|uniref:PucR family transcriptional regulator n=1 Tax=Metabacillus litoralis TaxID=152268 RepID=UPI001B9032B0|nr:PucR family transcriptional regulator [Metabacillus litoralis]UHA61378.1 PucR family transcriptional regulator ligand-binding domain-containing protein [Metabacillus litoralis]
MDNNNTGFTCADVLLIPHFSESVVLAGAKGMQNNITRVNVMEVPDVVDWVRPGDFLITSGFPFQDHPEMITDLIPQLVDKGVSAFGIKSRRYIDRIPERALELANQLGFPIFELPPSTSFSDVVREIMERVLVQEARNLSILQSRVQMMSNKLLNGEGLEEFLHTLDDMLENPVMIADETNQMFMSPQAIELNRMLSDSVWLKKIREDSIDGVSFIHINNRRIRVYIVRVNTKRGNNSLLMLFEWNKEYTIVDQLTIDRVSILVGLEMMNIHARKEVEFKYIDQFLQDWLTGKIANLVDLQMRAEACGYPFDNYSPFIVGITRWRQERKNTFQLQKTISQHRQTLLIEGIHLTLLEGELVFLFSHNSQTEVDRILHLIQKQLGADSQLCIGKKVKDADNVNLSYIEAKKISHICHVCRLEDVIVRFDQLGVFQLLYLLPECEELEGFRERYIYPIVNYDKKNKTILIETLQVYFKHNKNYKKVSEELFTHYNTIIYRIERVFDILNLNINDGDHMLLLQLAIKIHEMSPGINLGRNHDVMVNNLNG